MIKAYREANNLTQSQLADELQEICPGIDAPLISKFEKGICLPTPAVREYIEKQFANSFAESFVADGTIMPSELKNLLNGRFYKTIYEELQKGSRDYPVSRSRLVIATGESDRNVRKAISEMRKKGLPVMSSSSSYGYWITEELDADYRTFRAEMMSRCNDGWRTIRAMDRHFAEKGQIGIEQIYNCQE